MFTGCNYNKLSKYLYFIAKLIVCITAFYLTFHKLDIKKLLKYLEGVNVPLLLIAIIFAHLSLITSALRSKYYFQQYGLALSYKFSIILYYLGSFYNIVLPGGIGGDGYKVYLLSKIKGFSKIMSLRIILYERVNGFYILIFFGLIFSLFSNWINSIYYLKWLVVINLILITPSYLVGVQYILRDQIKTAINASYYSIIVQLLQILMFLFALMSLNNQINAEDIINFCILFIISSVIAIFPISIGGAGLRELTFFYGLDFINPHLQSLGVAIALVVFAISVITCSLGVIFSFNVKNYAK